MVSKKAISPVVAMGLLFVIAVVSVTGFMSWYSQYASSLFTDTEEKDSISSSLVDAKNGNLYFKSGKNQTITHIDIANNHCLNQTNVSKGMNTINISDCLNNVSGKYQVIVIADKTYSKYFYEEGILSFSDSNSNSQSCNYAFAYEPVNSQVGSGESSFIINENNSLEAPNNDSYIIGLDNYINITGDNEKSIAFSFDSVSPNNVFAFKVFNKEGNEIFSSSYTAPGTLSSITELAFEFNKTHFTYFAGGSSVSFKTNGSAVNFALISKNGSVTITPKFDSSEFILYNSLEGLCEKQEEENNNPQENDSQACYYRMNASTQQLQGFEDGALQFSLSNNEETMTHTYTDGSTKIYYASPSYVNNSGNINFSNTIDLSQGTTAITFRVDSTPQYTSSPYALGFGGIVIFDQDKLFEGDNYAEQTSLFAFNSSGWWTWGFTNDSDAGELFNVIKTKTTNANLPLEVSLYFNATNERVGYVVDGVDSGYKYDYEPAKNFVVTIFNGQTSTIGSQVVGDTFEISILSNGEDITNALPSGTKDMCGNTIN